MYIALVYCSLVNFPVDCIRERTDLGTDSGLVPVDRDRYRSNGRPVTDLYQLSML